MFEKYRIPGLYICKDSVLSCYSCGRTSGLVVDMGDNGTVLSPVLDGWVERRCINRSVVGGRYLDGVMLSILKANGVDPEPLFKLTKSMSSDNKIVATKNPNITNIHPSYETFMKRSLIKDLKDSVCRMADSNLTDAGSRYATIPFSQYELPDGTLLDLGMERFQVPECLVTMPTAAPNEFYSLLSESELNSPHPRMDSVPRLICDSILSCEPEFHSSLLSNIVVTGGSSSFEGTPERIKAEVENIMYTHMAGLKVKSIAAGASERHLCTWLGGSILASLGSFHDMWVTGKEYAEYGPDIIDKKCP